MIVVEVTMGWKTKNETSSKNIIALASNDNLSCFRVNEQFQFNDRKSKFFPSVFQMNFHAFPICW